MKTKKTLVLVLFFLFESISGKDVCSPTFCSPTGPQVRFPFRLVERQPSRCGFFGFDLSCNEKNQTILKLPSSRSFIVNHISYSTQEMTVDPDFCGPEKLTPINLIFTPFQHSLSENYAFYNCSSQSVGFKFATVPMISFPCLGSVNHSVFAVKTSWIAFADIPESCNLITRIFVPNKLYDDIRSENTLIWFAPYCRSCEANGKTCAYNSMNGRTTCVESSSHGGISWGAKYGLGIGIGVPGFVCLMSLICYISRKVGNYNESQNQSTVLLSNAISRQPPSTTGLDGSTIESYPKTVLGESCELPKDDGTCAICLSDYHPKEEVRTIPECNHYFHADCIDEWLKLNATCPVCRKSPQSSSLVTPSS